MSLGERISTIRKEKGLSQEAFGNELNVTRQTVSKWELDQAYPEVNKLIEISKKYNVSIEWLIGNQENRNSSDDLTEKQLQTVETIFNQYLDKKPERQYKKYVKYIFFIFILIILFGWGNYLKMKMEMLESKQNYLINQFNDLEDYIDNELKNIEDSITELLKNQNSYYYSNVIEIIDYDHQTNQATLHVELILKEEKNNANIKIEINNNTYKLTRKESNLYVGDIQFNLVDEFDVNVIYEDNTINKIEKIKEFKKVLSNTRYKAYWDLYDYYQKEVHITGSVLHPYNDVYIPCDIKEIQAYMFVDDEYVGKESIIPTLNSQGYYNLDLKFKITDLVDEISTKDSIISIYTVLTDEFDRTYVVTYNEYFYQPKVNKFSEYYSSNYEPDKTSISFNWQDYE